MLRAAIKLEEPHSDRPSKWHSIARHVPGRTNKDCRKRWCATMASIVSKGGWSAEEDRKLLTAVDKHGTKWSLVASLVETRNSGQCAKRWNDTLNPEIDRSAWSSDEDAKLLDAVNTHGTSWTTIVKLNFPGRTALAAKNRYSHLSRSSHSKRSSSPSSSTSSADTSEVSSPAPLTDGSCSNADSASTLAEEKSKLDPLISDCMDQMDFMFNDATPPSPSSSSSSCPSTPLDMSESKASNNIQMLEKFLNGLAAGSESDSSCSGSKFGEFSFSDQFLACPDTGPMAQELFDPSLEAFSSSNSACLLPNIAGLDDNSFQLDAGQIPSLWSGVDSFDIPTMDMPAQGSTSGRTSPTPSFNNHISLANLASPQRFLPPDQQIAVAVAICRADNLRPTVQILIQSLAGALAQPVTPAPSSSSSSKA